MLFFEVAPSLTSMRVRRPRERGKDVQYKRLQRGKACANDGGIQLDGRPLRDARVVSGGVC